MLPQEQGLRRAVQVKQHERARAGRCEQLPALGQAASRTVPSAERGQAGEQVPLRARVHDAWLGLWQAHVMLQEVDACAGKVWIVCTAPEPARAHRACQQGAETARARIAGASRWTAKVHRAVLWADERCT